jgi:hypothetical protein
LKEEKEWYAQSVAVILIMVSAVGSKCENCGYIYNIEGEKWINILCFSIPFYSPKKSKGIGWIKGKLVIQLKEQPGVTLSEGQMAVIPKGVDHCPKSMESSYVLLFEPFILQTIGYWSFFLTENVISINRENSFTVWTLYIQFSLLLFLDQLSVP